MKTRLVVRITLAVASVGAGSLLSTDRATADESVTGGGLEEIVVTAQKRAEDLQSVPISISALSASDIERRSVSVPGL